MVTLSNPFDALTSAGSPPSGKAGFRSPVGAITDRITSGFGRRDQPVKGASTNHKGIDFSPQSGSSGYPVEAAASGRVSFAGKMSGYGTVVEIEHADGTKTRYGHLANLNVKTGDVIEVGTPVGVVGGGKVGRSTGPHLHFEAIDRNGKKIDPRSVVDLTNRSLSVTPSPRPSDDIGSLMAFDTIEPAAAPASYAPLDLSRFGAPASLSSPMGMVSSPVSPVGGYARAEAPVGFSQPSPERFGRTVADIDPARFGPSPAPSPERFGRAPAAAQTVTGPYSPAGSYAVATGPVSAPARTGGLGGLGGMAAAQKAAPAPDPSRFGPAEMTSTAKTGRATGPMAPSSVTPMAASLSPPSLDVAGKLTGGLSQHSMSSLVSPMSVSTTPATASTMAALPSNFSVPVGPASTFNAVPSTAMTNYKGQIARAPVTSLPVSVVPPAIAAPVAAPKPAPAIAPTVARQAVSPQTTASVRSAPQPTATAADVYAGRASSGVASNGATVSRDEFGNMSVTNSYGVTTVTDPSGRQMGNLGGVGKALGGMFDKVTPGMVGSVIGGAIAGVPGALVGGAIGNKMGGGQSTGQKTGGLGGLGGFLSGLFGGSGSGSSGGGRGGGSSGGGGRSGSGSNTPGADRDRAGNT